LRRSANSTVDVGVFGVAAAILSAVPFVLVMIGLCWSVLKALREERAPDAEPTGTPEPGRAAGRPSGTPAPQQARAVDPNAGN
jgi:choline-glycine betaine transporter